MKKTIATSFLLTLAVWLAFSWPLPLHLRSAIPSTSIKPAQRADVLTMQPGDNLQLDYHFWLFSDMLAGKTPWFYNLYEFNTGDDKERYEPGSYYFPFSLFYAIGSWMGGRAFGWNFAGFVSLWLTAWLTFLLVRRYTVHPAAAWLGAAAAIALPYRWINLVGGSPTGFATAWVPLLFLGLDIAVREDKFRGGIMAGLAILLSAWTDAHTFFFGMLSTPAWCVFAFVQRTDFRWKDWRSYARLVLALAPVAVFAVLAYVSSKTVSHQVGEAKSAVRSLAEVALYTPHSIGLWSWEDHGISNHIYIGIEFAAIVGAGFLLGFAMSRRPRWGLTWLLLAVALFGIIQLALGPYGLHGGYCFRLARRLVHQYGMIRQPAKVFCLAPSLIAVAIGLAVSVFQSQRTMALAMGVLLLAEWRMQSQPQLIRYDLTQGAYQAVAQAAADHPAHALVLPLWPGDSHYASIYQHDASLYRVRMMDGYRPFVAMDYIEKIFHGYASANLGVLSEAQIDDLQKRGVDFILLHEDLFPEKVSPFPVGFTLQNLLNNPRLQLIGQDRSVWAFRIGAPHPREEALADWKPWYPARYIEWEHQHPRATVMKDDPTASDGACVSFEPGTGKRTRVIESGWADGLRWMIRARGHGTIAAAVGDSTNTLDVDNETWTWLQLPLAWFAGTTDVGLTLRGASGNVDVDAGLLTAGSWQLSADQPTLQLPAAGFFHAGMISPEDGGVKFSAENDRAGPVFYGPRLPLAPGLYRIALETPSSATPDMDLGTFTLRYEGGKLIREFPALAGISATAFHITENLPLMLVFTYSAVADCEIRSLKFERLGDR